MIFRWWSSDTVAVVTGANRGIGFEIAHQLASHGLTVVLTSRETGVGEEAVKVMQEGGLNVAFHQLDIVDHSSIEAFSDWIKETYGGLDILINNAGVSFNVGTENSMENAETVIQTNYVGTKNMTKAMIPLMRTSHYGARIVSVTSRLGRLHGKKNGDGLKYSLNAYTRLMARILEDRPEGHKIYINCYCPGWVKTAMTGWAGHISPEDAADTAVWLALLPDQFVSVGVKKRSVDAL
ncbi:hypothetical protein H5410_062261, partial [Solanum commersonii]